MTDGSLIKQCQSGDASAFEALLEHYYEHIYAIAFRWCQDPSNAQDITQLVCMKLSKSIHKFRFESSFITWLYPLVINCAKDFYKSPKQRNTREAQIDDLPEQAASSDDLSARRIYAQQILTQINLMQDEYKESLMLVYGAGLSHQQAAAKLQIKESTVSWRIHEARKSLKKQFKTSNLNDSSEDRSKSAQSGKKSASNTLGGLL